MISYQTVSEYVRSLRDTFPGRDSLGYVTGFGVYHGGLLQQPVAGLFPTWDEAQVVADECAVHECHVVVCRVTTAKGRIIHDPCEIEEAD